ncbi:hypothetical protein Z950_2369 [Sulfitobacter mediterraneus KCTC 32188]|nr:hypothetical protein Z950_2369 [Sulfitobacter mediterraneus KCTC 32188]
MPAWWREGGALSKMLCTSSGIPLRQSRKIAAIHLTPCAPQGIRMLC